MESFKKRSLSLYPNPLDAVNEKIFVSEQRKHATPVRAPQESALLTQGIGEYTTGASKAPKVAALLGQTSEDLKKQILQRMKNDNLVAVAQQIAADGNQRSSALNDEKRHEWEEQRQHTYLQKLQEDRRTHNNLSLKDRLIK